MIRAFVALRLGHDIIARLARLSQDLQQGPGGQVGRWVRPDSIHLTLKFLGDVDEQRMPNVYAAISRACRDRRPLNLRLSGTGCFPNPRRPRVVWVGIDDESGQLAKLQESIEEELVSEGFVADDRAFRPHLTLGRIRRGTPREQAALLGASASHARLGLVASFEAKEVHVIQSELASGGARYTNLYAAQLSGPGDPESSKRIVL